VVAGPSRIDDLREPIILGDTDSAPTHGRVAINKACFSLSSSVLRSLNLEIHFFLSINSLTKSVFYCCVRRIWFVLVESCCICLSIRFRPRYMSLARALLRVRGVTWVDAGSQVWSFGSFIDRLR
jgi:hypothetical protein